MVWDELQNLRTADLDVRERLNGLEKNWVIGMLVSRTGVNGALWRGENGFRLSVEYDADVVNGPETPRPAANLRPSRETGSARTDVDSAEDCPAIAPLQDMSEQLETLGIGLIVGLSAVGSCSWTFARHRTGASCQLRIKASISSRCCSALSR